MKGRKTMEADPFYLWWVAERGGPPLAGESELFDLCRRVWAVRSSVEEIDDLDSLALVRGAWEAAGPEYEKTAPPETAEHLSVVARFQRDYTAAAPPTPKPYGPDEINVAVGIKMRVATGQPISFVAESYDWPEAAVRVVVAALEVGATIGIHRSDEWDAKDLADAEQNAHDEYPSLWDYPGAENRVRTAERAAYLVGRQHERRLQAAKGKSA
jgi:hypothetical protein